MNKKNNIQKNQPKIPFKKQVEGGNYYVDVKKWEELLILHLWKCLRCRRLLPTKMISFQDWSI